jgi:excisionase family DNA binding protein
MHNDNSKIAFSPQGAANAVEVGRNKIYQWLNDGSLPAKKDGGRTLITDEALKAKVASLPDYEPAG